MSGILRKPPFTELLERAARDSGDQKYSVTVTPHSRAGCSHRGYGIQKVSGNHPPAHRHKTDSGPIHIVHPVHYRPILVSLGVRVRRDRFNDAVRLPHTPVMSTAAPFNGPSAGQLPFCTSLISARMLSIAPMKRPVPPSIRSARPSASRHRNDMVGAWKP